MHMGSVSSSPLQSFGTNLAVVEALRPHLCKCNGEAVRGSTANLVQFVPISANQSFRTRPGRWNERTQ